MKKIQLTPTELRAQAAEMTTLMGEYETLFASVTATLNNANSNWSANLSHNFTGKISAAQKSFSSIVDMLQFGANAAANSAESFENIDILLAKAFDGKNTKSKSQQVNGESKSDNSEKSDISTLLNSLKSILGVHGKIMEKDAYSTAGGILGNIVTAYETITDVITGNVDRDTYTKVVKEILDIFGKFEGGERLGVLGAVTDFIAEEWKILDMANPIEFLQNADGYIEAAGDLGMEIGKYWGLVSEGLSGYIIAQKALTNVTTIATMGTKLVGDVIAFSSDGTFDLRDFGNLCMDIGAYGGSSLVKGLTLGLLDIDAEGAINTYSENAEKWSDFLCDTGLPLGVQCAGGIVGSPFVFVASTAEIVYETVAEPLKILEKGTEWALENISSGLTKLLS